jgi:hypothetical protein
LSSERPKLISTLATTAQLAARVSLRLSKLCFTNTAVGAVEACFTAGTTKRIARTRDWRFEPSFAAQIPAALADWIGIKQHGGLPD